MPYTIEKRGAEWCIVDVSGKAKQCHDSMVKAKRARRAIMMTEEDSNVHGKVRHGGKQILETYKKGAMQ